MINVNIEILDYLFNELGVTELNYRKGVLKDDPSTITFRCYGFDVETKNLGTLSDFKEELINTLKRNWEQQEEYYTKVIKILER